MENTSVLLRSHNVTNDTNGAMIESNLISDYIYEYLCPLLAVTGIVCNLITFIGLLRPPINGISVSVYLKAYCIAALLNWVFVIGINWISHSANYGYVRNISQISCRFWAFLTSIIPFAGFWFLTGAALDRVFVLWTPIKAQILCTGFMAKNAVVFILVGLTAVSIHAMWMYNLEEFGCFFDRHDYFNRMWMWTSGLLLGCLSLLSLFILGNMILICLCLKHHGRQIPDLSKNEMDITYSVMIVSLIIFSCASPMNVIHILQLYDSENVKTLKLHSEFAAYTAWICYLCVFFVLICCCSAFRDALRDSFKECIDRLRRRNTTIELKLMNAEYDQVPSTSTSV